MYPLQLYAFSLLSTAVSSLLYPFLNVSLSSVLYTFFHVCYSYMTLIGVHEMHGRMHLNQGHLFAIDPLSLFGYLTVSPTHPVTGN